jgi:hypothetical protein
MVLNPAAESHFDFSHPLPSMMGDVPDFGCPDMRKILADLAFALRM